MTTISWLRTERGRRHLERVHAGDGSVIAREGDPPLEDVGVGVVLAETSDVAGHGSFGHREAEFLKFAQDPRGAPMVFSDHLANEVANLGAG